MSVPNVEVPAVPAVIDGTNDEVADGAGAQVEPPAVDPILGFPKDTPIAAMTPEQEAAYWRNESKKQQRIADEKTAAIAVLEREKLSDAERAAEDARAGAESVGEQRARAATLPRLMVAELRARGLSVEDAKERIEFLDLTKFVDESGELKDDALDKFAGAVAAPVEQSRRVGPADVFSAAGGQIPPAAPVSLSLEDVQKHASSIYNLK